MKKMNYSLCCSPCPRKSLRLSFLAQSKNLVYDCANRAHLII